MVCRDVVAKNSNRFDVIARKFGQKIPLNMSKKKVSKKSEVKAEIEGRKSLLFLQKSAFQKIMNDLNGHELPKHIDDEEDNHKEKAEEKGKNERYVNENIQETKQSNDSHR
jgi:hypothetical protein